MNIEHKPGVLCLIISGITPKGKSNVGKTVELVKYLEPDHVHMVSDNSGLRNGDECAAWLVKGYDIGEPGHPDHEYGLYGQSALLPIKDPDQDFVEDRKYKVVVTIDGVPVESYAPDEEIRLCI